VYLEGTGTVNVGTASPNSYINGALYVNTLPQDMQMAFNLLFDSGWAFIGVIKEIFIWLKVVLVGIFIFVIPGWGILLTLWSGWKNSSFIVKLLLSSGVSIAIYPIIFLWVDLFGFQLGPLLGWVPAIIGTVVIIWRNRGSNPLKRFQAQLISIKSDLAYITGFLIVVGLIIFTRLWGVRILDVPLWGDSYHHTMISQLLVNNGGLFDSWEPYADLSSFTYHFGFHALAAVFHWVTGLQLSESVIFVGQLLNVLAVLTLFPLAKKLGVNRWAGVFAILVAGLLIPLPMFYVNWGRYTQLTGQVILLVMMYFLWDLIEKEDINWKSILITSVLIAGIALSHYRVLFFGLLFMLTLFFFYIKNTP
jgi:hypothetical protein